MTNLNGVAILIAAALSACLTSIAHAQRAPVIVVQLPVGDPLGRRLAAEAGLSGFDLRLMRPDDSAPLDRLADDHLAVAAVRIDRGATGDVAITIADRLTDKTVLRRLTPHGDGRAVGDAELSLQVVELLRGTFLELRVAMRAPTARPPAAVESLLGPPPQPRLYLTAAGALALTASDQAATSAAALEAGVRLTPRWRLGLLAALPLTAAALDSGSGRLTLRPALFGLEVSRLGGQPHARVRPVLHATAGATWLRGQGAAAPPFTSRRDEALLATGCLGATVQLRLHGQLRLLTGLRAGLTWPRAQLLAAGQTTAHWGGLFVLATLGLTLGS